MTHDVHQTKNKMSNKTAYTQIARQICPTRKKKETSSGSLTLGIKSFLLRSCSWFSPQKIREHRRQRRAWRLVTSRSIVRLFLLRSVSGIIHLLLHAFHGAGPLTILGLPTITGKSVRRASLPANHALRVPLPYATMTASALT